MTTILSGRYANPEHTSAVIKTVEKGDVAISAADHPELWAFVHTLFNPDVYSAPPLPVPDISDRQFFHVLARKGMITQQEALDAVKTGAIPAVFEQFMGHFGASEFDVRMLLSGAVTFERNHSLTNAFGSFLGLSPIDLDNLFREASAL
jgi:hypothetical protein